MERAEQVREIRKIGLGWSDHSKGKQIRTERVDKREVIILDQIRL